MKISGDFVKTVAAMTVAVASLAPAGSVYAANPFLPLWEYIPDGEPYVFEDPDNPGKFRVYIYGSHDSRKTEYCGLEQVVWSAPVDSLTNWRYDGVIFESKLNADGKPLNDGASVTCFLHRTWQRLSHPTVQRPITCIRIIRLVAETA